METHIELRKLQIELTKLAVDIGNTLDKKLDFSIDSIKIVDSILEDIHQDYKKTKNEEGLHGIALEMAAYIISVIEKNLNQGWWERDHIEMGKDTFPYYLTEDKVIFPYSWAIKRIVDGNKENIWQKFDSWI